MGSNMGDRIAYLRFGREALREGLEAQAIEQSPVYQTEPVDVSVQDRDRLFLNAVVIMQSGLAPRRCLEICQDIERRAGRVASERANAPRPLDIDILYAGDLVIGETGLVVPHPRWHCRRFVLRPLADLRPRKLLPLAGDTVSNLLDELDENARVDVFRKSW